MSLKISIFWKICALTFLIIPIAINVNKLMKFIVSHGFHSSVLALIGISVLATFQVTIIWICKQHRICNKDNSWHLYAFSMLASTSVLSFGIGLEQSGYIKDFVGEYLKSGEPYLFCPFGCSTCYFDGTFTYSIYLYMINAISNKKCYRSVGLYWSGTLINSMLVLFLGILWGKFGIFSSSSINIPYLVAPVVIALQLLNKRPMLQKSYSPYVQLRQRPLDVLLLTLIVTAAFITILRATAIMDNHIGLANYYVEKIEPFLMLDEPSPFVKVQMLIYLFYVTPIYALSCYGLIVSNCAWLKDVTLFHAGVMAQGQFVHIATSLQPGISSKFQIPGTQQAQCAFWLVNVFLAVLPHLILIRCYTSKPSRKSAQNEK